MRQRLRDADVWAKVDATGAPIADREGRVEIIYKAEPGAKVYRAAARNLTPMGGDAVELEVAEPAPPKQPGATAAIPSNAVQVWTDGGCAPNPGPGGIGVLIVDGQDQRELAEYLGHSTNNICELTAILRGLELVPDKARPVIVYTDSQYAIGMLHLGYKAKANQDLIAETLQLVRQFKDLRFIKVLAHSGIALNERVDQLVHMGRAKGR
jgi:ribonuclease HI